MQDTHNQSRNQNSSVSPATTAVEMAINTCHDVLQSVQ
ncbi:hypothetical Protein YC6258_04075 [Gynuella sunshinyii YC6258]|uniref:Uncharacterized protein n=1 Tax=Gynuella sunshinyii YC6258 TaxID=1445510 RepID=A0A0C5VPB9_9GAMM|nr:hypothetical Protein YC6258_04075 [Gynuella sunshinyii YC6258]